jgi:hypothetical protein
MSAPILHAHEVGILGINGKAQALNLRRTDIVVWPASRHFLQKIEFSGLKM